MRTSDYIIYLENLEVKMFLGIHDYEKTSEQRVLISVKIAVSQKIRQKMKFYDYDKVRNFISGYSGKKVDTQEDLVSEILKFLMNDAYVNQATVMSKKPDVFPDAEYVGVSATAQRE